MNETFVPINLPTRGEHWSNTKRRESIMGTNPDHAIPPTIGPWTHRNGSPRLPTDSDSVRSHKQISTPYLISPALRRTPRNALLLRSLVISWADPAFLPPRPKLSVTKSRRVPQRNLDRNEKWGAERTRPPTLSASSHWTQTVQPVKAGTIGSVPTEVVEVLEVVVVGGTGSGCNSNAPISLWPLYTRTYGVAR